MYKLKFTLAVIAALFLSQSFVSETTGNRTEQPIASIRGVAPSLAVEDNNLLMTYASGDTIFFCFSSDQGKTFSAATRVAILPGLSVGGGRGPQIVVSKDHLIVAVTDKAGNIYSFMKNKTAPRWEKTGRINDVAEIAKEGFVSLAAGNENEVYAVWLDLRNNKKNKVAGAKSLDGGKTWLKNKIIYTSPEGTVCECCKPSVEMKNKMIVVMFRNLLKGNRDLFIIKSIDGGLSFGKAQKLGAGSWKLNACPMDGGGLVINNDNTINTVWRREKDIYTCRAGSKEKVIAVGKQCTIAGDNGNSFIAFVNEGKVYCVKPGGQRVELGAGVYPDLIMTSTSTAACSWQNDDKVYCAPLER